MNPRLMVILLLIVFSVMRIPIGISLIFSCTIYIITSDLPLLVMAQRVSGGLNSYLYVAIPLFILAGNIMEDSGITNKLIYAARLLVGHLHGGLAQVNVLTSTMFSAVNGSALADIAATGPVIIPAMKKVGFGADFSAAISSASALIGPVIPPSISFVVYASIANVSIGRMFLAGFVPGIIMCCYQMAYCYYVAKKRSYPRTPRASAKERVIGLTTSMPALLMPIIIIGGIASGLFTPTESAAIAVLYGLGYTVITGNFKAKVFARQLYKAGVVTCAVLLVVAGASLLGFILTIEGTARQLVAFLMAFTTNTYVTLFILAVALLIFGMFMSVNAAVVILAPLLLPVARALNFDLVWFGVLMCLWLSIGLLTPPVCSVLQLTCIIAKIRLGEGFREVLPFILLMLFMTVLIVIFPKIVLFLPYYFMP